MNEKACKNCKMILKQGTECPNCHSKDLTTNWKGFTIIFNPQESEIAKKMDVSLPGKYALRLAK